MQNALEEVILSLEPVDVDNGGIFESVLEEANHPLVRVVLQRMEGCVDHYPSGLAQQETREDQALLLVFGDARWFTRVSRLPDAGTWVPASGNFTVLRCLPFLLTNHLSHGFAGKFYINAPPLTLIC